MADLNVEESRERARMHAQMRINIQTTALRCEHWQSCLNCDSFSEGVGKEKRKLMESHPPAFCTLHNAHPPAHVIVNGCVDWTMDIPF